MGYYADLIKEKRNARDYDEINKLSKEIKQIVSELRRKYTHIRQTDDVNFLLDVLHDRGQQIPQSDKNKAEHAMQLDETRRRMSVAPRDWGNSKEEKQNFRDPLGLGLTFHELGTPDDYKAKFKKGDKVKLRYGSGFKGEGVIVEGPIKMRASLTPTYRIKLTDGKVVGRYEEELAKNSKEEKDNASVQDRFRYKGCMITILKKGENQYTFSVEQNGHEEGTNTTYPTQDKAEAEAKIEVDTVWNSKGENMNYYEKLIAEKKNTKMNADDRPFTKKSECVATLDKIINLAQRKKSQVQGWRTIDEDFDENEFLSDLKDALQAVDNIIG